MSNILLLTFDPHRDLKSWGQHVSLEPGEKPVECLCIARKNEFSLKPAAYVIPLNNLFKFAAPENQQEEFDLLQSCINIANILGCPKEKKDLMRIAMYVQDSIDKVFTLKPYMGEGKAIADVKGTLNGKEFTSEVTAH